MNSVFGWLDCVDNGRIDDIEVVGYHLALMGAVDAARQNDGKNISIDSLFIERRAVKWIKWKSIVWRFIAAGGKNK